MPNPLNHKIIITNLLEAGSIQFVIPKKIAIIIVIITKYQPRYDISCFFNIIPTAVARMKRLRKPKQEKRPLAFIAMNVDS